MIKRRGSKLSRNSSQKSYCGATWSQCFRASSSGFPFCLGAYSSADVAQHKALFSALCLTEKDIGVIYNFYNRVHIDRSGLIGTWELLEFLGMERNRFTNRVFSLFDEDGNNTIDMRELLRYRAMELLHSGQFFLFCYFLPFCPLLRSRRLYIHLI